MTEQHHQRRGAQQHKHYGDSEHLAQTRHGNLLGSPHGAPCAVLLPLCRVAASGLRWATSGRARATQAGDDRPGHADVGHGGQTCKSALAAGERYLDDTKKANFDVAAEIRVTS